jgi:hypothetical protein
MSQRKIAYTLDVTYLLNAMQKISAIIVGKRYKGYKSDYDFLKNELFLSDNDAKNELSYIYSSCKFNEHYFEMNLIETISKDILDHYEPDDLYQVTRKEFFCIFLKKY